MTRRSSKSGSTRSPPRTRPRSSSSSERASEKFPCCRSEAASQYRASAASPSRPSVLNTRAASSAAVPDSTARPIPASASASPSSSSARCPRAVAAWSSAWYPSAASCQRWAASARSASSLDQTAGALPMNRSAGSPSRSARNVSAVIDGRDRPFSRALTYAFVYRGEASCCWVSPAASLAARNRVPICWARSNWSPLGRRPRARDPVTRRLYRMRKPALVNIA